MHDGILHALAIFYFRIACELFAALPMRGFSWNSSHRIPHGAIKYIGNFRFADPRKLFPPVWARLKEVCKSIAFDLVGGLHTALTDFVEETDRLLNHLAEGHPKKPPRDELVIDAQVWRIAFTNEGKHFASSHSCPEETIGGYVRWRGQNYNFTFRKDPVPAWRDRLASIQSERSPHVALKKYQEFVSQTEFFRELSKLRLGRWARKWIDRSIPRVADNIPRGRH